MARIQASKGLLDRIKQKAESYAQKNGTYGTRSTFDLGKVIVTLETVLSRQPSMRLAPIKIESGRRM
ncbi:hypothetical protein [Alkalimarinus coralli]|uniref:hypothetical protein n=1 Tax=Alkalimarinus coralli TaxID=2935863 RepID=UPI00202B3D50|nr:hypothetical protein [Alkalimarinus coralli]